MLGKQPEDISFNAEIVGNDVQPALRPRGPGRRIPHRAIVPLIDALGRHRLGEIHALEAGKFLRRPDGIRLVDILLSVSGECHHGP